MDFFTLRGEVSRRRYAIIGFALAFLKYLVELSVVKNTTGLFLTPVHFLSPFIMDRQRFLNAGPDWLGFAWIIWTIPFVWVAVAMTLRRTRNAAVNAWICLLILVPIINLETMIVMACLPAKKFSATPAPKTQDANLASRPALKSETLSSALLGLLAGTTYSVGLVVLSVYGFGSYGSALFFGAPVVTGATATYFLSRNANIGLGSVFVLNILLVTCCSASLLLLGLEGAICILMALPIMGPLTIFGGFLGWAIASATPSQSTRDDRGFMATLVILPMLAWAEPVAFEPLPLDVSTQVYINAPPEQVWDTVIAFPEIKSPPAWFFRWGIAAPLRARIDGRGVGAVRHCEFTTGSFVEPITVWDKPKHLAFDVTEQPDPMLELTPYRHLHPPHLQISFRSNRGEFRLQPTDNGGTLLTGRTWYTLDIAPHTYWRLWTDKIVHRIHLRVLHHIRNVVETHQSAKPVDNQ